MKRDSLLPVILLISVSAYSQTGSLRGQVTEGSKGLEYATLQIDGTSLGTLTDADGRFFLEEVPTGESIVKVRLMGYQTFTQKVTVMPGETLKLDIRLKEDRLSLNEVVVSGTRYDLDRREAPVIVNVLTSKLLNATQSMTLSEGLSYQPGVRVETNCQNCGFTQVRLNGLEGAYSQILINSRPVFSALNSVYGLDQIPTNIVERVEVVRGGGSALYGSNAIGGTINIITKEPVENTWQISSNFALIDGSVPDHTVNYNGSLVSEDLRSGVTLYGMFRKRDHYDANGDGFSEITQLENNTFGVKTFFKPGPHSKLTLDFNAIKEYRRGGDHLDLAPHFTDITEELDHNTIIGGITFDQFTRDNQNKFSFYTSVQTTGRESFYGGLGGGRTATDSLAAVSAYGSTEDLALVNGIQYIRNFGASGVLTLGVENQLSNVQDEIPGYNRLIDQRVNTTGAYGQYEWKPNSHFTALLGARYDHASVDGNYDIGNVERTSEVSLGVLSPRITILYDISSSLQFRGGYARGFRAPQAFNEDLHISSVGGEPRFVILEADLDKELSDSYTASLSYTPDLGKVQASFLIEGFYTNLRNPFTTVSTGAVLPNGSILEEVRNGEGAYVSGANFELSVSPSASLFFQAGGTAQESIYREDQVLFASEAEPDVITGEFVRTPNLYGYLAANWTVTEALALDITGTYTGPMTIPKVVNESGFPELVESPPFVDVNLKVAHHFDLLDHFHLELSGGVQNVFDSYQDDFDTGAKRDSDYIYGPARPRTFFLGLKIGNFH